MIRTVLGLCARDTAPAGMLAVAEVREHIVERLGDKRRRDAQRSWIKQLFARSDTRQPA